MAKVLSLEVTRVYLAIHLEGGDRMEYGFDDKIIFWFNEMTMVSLSPKFVLFRLPEDAPYEALMLFELYGLLYEVMPEKWNLQVENRVKKAKKPVDLNKRQKIKLQ